MGPLRGFLREQAEGLLISWLSQQQAAARFDLSIAAVEEQILCAGLLPARYARNQQMITTAEQLRLFCSRVAVIGCGGLGGYLLEELARLGIGRVLAVDPDRFEEHNLNRQLLATLEGLGRPKVEAAQQRLAEINPAVEVQPLEVAFDREGGAAMLAGVDLVLDAVDNIPTRLALAEVCRELDIPLIHGAIAGWYAQVVTVYPGDDSLEKLYANWSGGKGVEARLGNPSFTPALTASLQAAEACKLLLGQGRPLRQRLLSINLLDLQFDEIPL